MQNTFQGTFDKVRQPAWTYGASGYSYYSYTKPGLLLRTLEHHLGEQTMARIMRTYHERWRFRHPTSEDFYAVANEVSGKDLGWFFKQAVEGTESLDYEVARASSVRTPAWRGLVRRGLGPDARVARTTRTRPRRTRRAKRLHEHGPREAARRVHVSRSTSRSSSRASRSSACTWDGQDRWKRYRFDRPERLEWVDVDPDRKVLLDANWLNNGRRIEASTPRPRPTGRRASRSGCRTSSRRWGGSHAARNHVRAVVRLRRAAARRPALGAQPRSRPRRGRPVLVVGLGRAWLVHRGTGACRRAGTARRSPT